MGGHGAVTACSLLTLRGGKEYIQQRSDPGMVTIPGAKEEGLWPGRVCFSGAAAGAGASFRVDRGAMETLATVFSDQYIDERIHCRKRIVKASPPRGMEENRKSNLIEQKQLVLTSLEDKTEFQIFVRRNTQYIEQFSIGLTLKISAISEGFPGRLVLLRYNGNHGASDWSEDRHYSCFHVHKITNELISGGVFEPKQITVTDIFSTFDQALQLFLEETNVQNVTEFFPWHNKQRSLFSLL